MVRTAWPRVLVVVTAIAVVMVACGRPARLPATAPNVGLGVDIAAFAFATAEHGVALTSNGLIETNDGGHTWRSTSITTRGTSAALIVGGRILVVGWHAFRSNGHDWTALPLPAGGGDVVMITFRTEIQGLAWVRGGEGSEKLFATQDGGGTWDQVSDLSGVADLHLGIVTTNGPEEAVFADALHGWMSSQFPPTEPSALFVTIDGGHTWSRQAIPQPPAGPPDWISTPRFIDQLHGVLFGIRRHSLSAGWFWTTLDGGRTWSSPRDLPVTSSTASFPDRLHWFISSGSQLLATADGGVTWHEISKLPTPYWESPLHFVDAIRGFALVSAQAANTCQGGASCGAPQMRRQLLATGDGGQTWRPITQPPPTPTPANSP